jgi:hypothetical protein
MMNIKMQTLVKTILHPAWNLPDLMQRVFVHLFSIFVYLIVILPTGTVFHVNVKLLVFAVIFPSAMNRMFKHTKLTLLHLSLLLLVPTTFLFWVLIGQFYDVPVLFSLLEYKDMLIMLVSTWLIGVAIGGDQQARERFLRVVLRAEIAACVLKIGLLCFAAATGMTVSALVDGINLITGADLMGADFGDSSFLGRIQFTADGLIPLCLYLLMMYRQRLGIRNLTAFISFVLLTISLLLTFSRYFWAFSGVALLLGLLFAKRDRFYAFLLTGVSLILLVSLPVLIPIAMLRFSVDVAGGSDDVRVLQIAAMKRYFWDAPLLGHGLGSHTDEIIRSESLPYLYEVQLLALANQVGIVGLLLLAAILLYYFHALFPWNRHWHGALFTAQLSISVLLCCWMAAGLFNPMLLSSTAAVSYGFLKALGEFEEPSRRTMRALPVAEVMSL